MRYRVLSPELLGTLFGNTRAKIEPQHEVRLNLLAQGFQRPDGSRVPMEEVRSAGKALRRALKGDGRPVESIPVADRVEQVQRRLGVPYAAVVEHLLPDCAGGGLEEPPVHIHPPAKALIRFLKEIRFPVLVLTDPDRLGGRSLRQRAAFGFPT